MCILLNQILEINNHNLILHQPDSTLKVMKCFANSLEKLKTLSYDTYIYSPLTNFCQTGTTFISLRTYVFKSVMYLLTYLLHIQQ